MENSPMSVYQQLGNVVIMN